MRILILSACLLLSASVYGQQRQGNIVEYFGKERIEKVDEGIVSHSFNEGYKLPVTTRNGYLFGTGDGLAWELATGKFTAPQEGKLMANNYGLTKNLIFWSPIKADSTGKFIGADMRNSYLYTEYNSPAEKIVLLQASGNTRTFINGMPHEGDHYDFAYTLIPFTLKKGRNEFIFTAGRFGRVEAKIITPEKPLMFTKRDMTLPDIINGEADDKYAAIRLINSQNKHIAGLAIKCELETGETISYTTDDIMPMTVRKIKFKVPASKSNITGEVKASLTLIHNGKEIDRTDIVLQQRSATVIHERTFVSKIDGSVQYYSVNPSTTQADGQAFILSVHGASVEARNQARAYSQKDWTHIVAPTNRRPFGFNWEEWGRIDALEVMEDAKKLLKPAPEKTYLTGHSMGGHGTWILGVTFPDMFAAIAPCAGYADISHYSRQNADSVNKSKKQFEVFERAANAGRTVEMKNNFLQQGVYIFHGSADDVVPPEQARRMRKLFGKFHSDFCYYEYPGGSHWFSNESVDWNPIFEFFKRHKLSAPEKMDHIDFTTASPGVSDKNHWVRVLQQDSVLRFSNVVLNVYRKDGENQTVKTYLNGKTKNVAAIELDLASLKIVESEISIKIDNQPFKVSTLKSATLQKVNGRWQMVENIPASEKNPARYGGFKFAILNNVVFVYATGGSKEENEWYMNKARFDAETFLYRGNGSIQVVADKDFTPATYADRNVVIYGNASNNKAWGKLLAKSPVQVKQGEITAGTKTMKGANYGTYFVYPHPDSKTAMVGVVAGTGIEGMKATYPNDYISGFTGSPDLSIFTAEILRDGVEGVKMSGFFGNDWSVENGQFIITE